MSAIKWSAALLYMAGTRTVIDMAATRTVIVEVKVAKHSFQVPMPNSPLLLNYL